MHINKEENSVSVSRIIFFYMSMGTQITELKKEMQLKKKKIQKIQIQIFILKYLFGIVYIIWIKIRSYMYDYNLQGSPKQST